MFVIGQSRSNASQSPAPQSCPAFPNVGVFLFASSPRYGVHNQPECQPDRNADGDTGNHPNGERKISNRQRSEPSNCLGDNDAGLRRPVKRYRSDDVRNCTYLIRAATKLVLLVS